MTRTFLAADVDEGILDGAAALATSLRATIQGRWVARDVMHATVRFFGDVDDERLAALVTLVPRLEAGPRMPRVRVTRLHAFPDLRRARVLVMPLEDEGVLASVHDVIEAHAAELGFERETRAYRPHLTLARLPRPSDVRAVVASVRPSLEGCIRSLTLYASKLGGPGPSYSVLARRSFEA